MFRILIADDEESMRFVLKKALLKLEDIEIVDEAQTGDQAVQLLEKYKPDAVFLDIDMPNMSGVEAAKLIADIDPKCMIVFVTAFQEYMSDAFEIYAFDYIVKPFKLDRLNQTVERMKMYQSAANFKERPKTTVELEDILLKNKDGMTVLHIEDIIFIQRENRSTVIITEDRRITTSETLTELETKLPSNSFLRSHKSYIIHIHKITTISPYGRWTYTVHFKGTKEDALMTYDKAKVLKEKFHWTIG